MKMTLRLSRRKIGRVLLVWLVLAGGCVGAAEKSDPPQPVVCKSAKSFRGGKLHSTPPRKTWTAAAGSLNGALDAATVQRLERALQTAFDATEAPSMTVAVGVPGRGSWALTTNHPALTDLPVPRWFWFASAGKTFTAVVVLQLVEEKKLKLDDKLARWFPDFPNARVITIDHLLTHTSGCYSFQNDPGFRADPGYKSPAELIAIARAHGSAFCPGELWSYSNTGYVLLGRIVEKIEGRPFHEVLTDRIIKRLSLPNTKALAPREVVAGLAPAHPAETDGLKPPPEFLTTPFAAGPIVASAGDMVIFWHAVLSGQLLPLATVRGQFRRLYPMFDRSTFYGRGVMLYDAKDPVSGHFTWLGHSGGAPGVKAVVAYAVETGAYVAVALNNDASAEATANLLLNALKPPRLELRKK